MSELVQEVIPKSDGRELTSQTYGSVFLVSMENSIIFIESTGELAFLRSKCLQYFLCL